MILFEDKYLMVINKFLGMVVYGGSGLSYGLIEVLCVFCFEECSLEFVYWLDCDILGCLFILKCCLVFIDLYK